MVDEAVFRYEISKSHPQAVAIGEIRTRSSVSAFCITTVASAAWPEISLKKSPSYGEISARRGWQPSNWAASPHNWQCQRNQLMLAEKPMLGGGTGGKLNPSSKGGLCAPATYVCKVTSILGRISACAICRNGAVIGVASALGGLSFIKAKHSEALAFA